MLKRKNVIKQENRKKDLHILHRFITISQQIKVNKIVNLKHRLTRLIFLYLVCHTKNIYGYAKKTFLLDALALIYRAYFAMSRHPQVNSKGLNTSAILGFANTLLDVIKKGENPTHLGIALDTMGLPYVRRILLFITVLSNNDNCRIPFLINVRICSLVMVVR